MVDLNQGFPIPSTPLVDKEGVITREWLFFLQAVFNRTGGAAGVDTAEVQIIADDALATADAALIAANAAQADADASLKIASNLGDVASAASSRNNLGLGPIATSATVTGWVDPAGTGSRATFDMDLALPVGAAYAQAEVTAIANQVIVLQKRLGQLILDQITVKTIGH